MWFVELVPGRYSGDVAEMPLVYSCCAQAVGWSIGVRLCLNEGGSVWAGNVICSLNLALVIFQWEEVEEVAILLCAVTILMYSRTLVLFIRTTVVLIALK